MRIDFDNFDNVNFDYVNFEFMKCWNLVHLIFTFPNISVSVLVHRLDARIPQGVHFNEWDF